MVHGAVARKFLADLGIGREFIRHQIRFTADHLHDGLAQRLSFHVRNVERIAVAVTINECQHSMLLRLRLRIGAIFLLAADYSFVALDNLVLSANWAALRRGHSLTNAMAHEPARLVRDAEHTA